MHQRYHPPNQPTNVRTNLSVNHIVIVISDSVSKSTVLCYAWLHHTVTNSVRLDLAGLTHVMSWVYAVSELTEHEFNQIFVNHSVTVCFHKQLLFANSYSVPLPSSQCHCVLAFKYWQDSFFKFFWFLFFFIVSLGRCLQMYKVNKYWLPVNTMSCMCIILHQQCHVDAWSVS